MLLKREPPHSPLLKNVIYLLIGLYREWCNLSNSGTQFVYEIALFFVSYGFCPKMVHPLRYASVIGRIVYYA